MFKKLLGTLLLLASFSAFADPQIGEDFDKTLQKIPTDNPSKIEVIELFWYGCPHCYHMDPLLEAWVKKQAPDVVFKRVPGLPQAAWAPMAKAFYALDDLKLSGKLHTALFDAIHKQKTLNPTDEAAAINWIAQAGGVDKSKVEASFKSFAMNSKLNRAAQIFQVSGATGVPTLIIDGQFATKSTSGGNEATLKTADYIIANVRIDRAKLAVPAKK
jgi:thiol:disulfide interchange protein DsbA